MGIITQRFIAVGNKLLAELRTISGTLQKLGHSIDEKNAAESKREQSQPILRAELEVPVSIREQNNGQDERANRREKWRLGVEIVTTLLVLGYATIAYFQLEQMIGATRAAEKANDFSLRVFEANERAVVIPDQPVEFLDQGLIKVSMRNSGKRPAGPFFLWIVPSRWRAGDPRPIATPTTESGTFRPDARRIPAGGHLDFVVPIEGMTATDVTRIRGGTEKLSVYITITYDNGFGKDGKFDANFQYMPKIGWVSNMPTFRTTGAEKVPNTAER
jgi:hypothetical protein